MTRKRCLVCRAWINHDEACPVCAKRSREANAGAAPEFGRGRTIAGLGRDRAGSLARHPSSPTLPVCDDEDCSVCAERGETAWHDREDVCP